jgi:hypothetical protein
VPILRYFLQVEGEDKPFAEQDTFPPRVDNNDIALIQEVILNPLNARRTQLNEPLLRLVRVVCISSCVHLHQWKKTRVDKVLQKTFYYCDRCKITAYRYTKLFDGEVGGIRRDPQYKNDRQYELCRDPLKPMPKLLDFGCSE